MASPYPLIAVDIGNNRIKLGLFTAGGPDGLPEPESTHPTDDDARSLDATVGGLAARLPLGGSWWIGSVNRPSTTRLVDWLRVHRPDDRITLLAAGDLDLHVALARPDMVGIDRLLDAVAANRLRRPGAPAVLVDVGSAITVDLVSAEGHFRGGSILPGIAMSARALHDYTDLLPLIDMSELTTPPPALGDATAAAMRAGLFWGAVGGIRQLIELLSVEAGAEPDIFLTGGAGPAVAPLLGLSARHVPHLTLAGIALTAARTSGFPA
jgi:type III pantothenate kinase